MQQLKKRGLFIALEGLDRCGKTSQCIQLTEHIKQRGKDVIMQRFPDRTTVIGSMLNSYLKGTQQLSDQAIHLLFSANRWEAQQQLMRLLLQGTSIICDRYAYSGVAYSAAKGLDREWCKSCDRGLIEPDVILYLHAPKEIIKARAGFGDEIFEKDEFQAKVEEQFASLFEDEKRVIVVQAVKSQEEVAKDIQTVLDKYLIAEYHPETISKLWLL